MPALRRLAWITLALAYLQIVFGAIVRITGSGLGCGDHWPKCNGSWFPPHDRIDLIIEITHRYIAAGLTVAIIALVATAWVRRNENGVGGRGGVLRSATLAILLVVAAALLGAATVRMLLNPFVIALHLAIAMALLAVLATTVLRSGGLGARETLAGANPRTWVAARSAVVLAFVTVTFGALTANLPDAAVACGGFPWCRWFTTMGTGFWVQVTHRVLAFLLLSHMWGVQAAVARRKEPRVVVRSARFAFGAILAQILIAALMVEMRLPPLFRSLHQAAGTLVWISVFIFAAIALRAARSTVTRAQQQREAA
ncbi:MAG TPA: COX15/CtaA family protein [Gemmatimonadaceae bacterium]